MMSDVLYRIDESHPAWVKLQSMFDEPTPDWLVPVEPDYEAMAAFIEEIEGLPGWWAPENRQALAKALWRAGIGGDEENREQP
jgi:hypothetical protein